MASVSPKIEASWLAVLKNEFEDPYFWGIKESLVKEKKENRIIYPPGPLIFNAFNLTPFDKVKVVIIGQDPYHGPGQAHGLCFSVPDGIPQPPSLKNIFKEIHDNLGSPIPTTGNLTNWAEQGVFLLNATLTVRARQANSHQQIGWQKFTDAVIRRLSEKREGLIFMLWGGFAKKKTKLIDSTKHHILQSGHPSPLSANKGYWFGNKHFITANELLEKAGEKPIDWSI